MRTVELPNCSRCEYAPEWPWLCNRCILEAEAERTAGADKATGKCFVCTENCDSQNQERQICENCLKLVAPHTFSEVRKAQAREQKARQKAEEQVRNSLGPVCKDCGEPSFYHKPDGTLDRFRPEKGATFRCGYCIMQNRNGRAKLGKDVGYTLKKYRKERGLTQAQLADGWGINRSMIAQVENGYRELPGRFQRRVSRKMPTR